MQPLQKGPYQIIDKHTEVTYKFTDSSKKEIVQLRNILLLYYPKEYALRELTQLYSFTGLQIIQNNLKKEQNQNTDKTRNQKTTQQKYSPQPSHTPEIKIPQKERKNTKMTEKFYHKIFKKNVNKRESLRLRSQPRKNYKTFIPQSKILKKVEFQKQL